MLVLVILIPISSHGSIDLIRFKQRSNHCRLVAFKHIIQIKDKRCPEISSVEINAKSCVGHCSYGCIYPIPGFEFTQLPCFACLPTGMKKERVAVLCGAKKIYKRVLIPTGCMCTKVDCTRS